MYFTRKVKNIVTEFQVRDKKPFNDSLRSKRFPEYKLVVSSVLRTGEDIARLRRSGNPYNNRIFPFYCLR